MRSLRLRLLMFALAPLAWVSDGVSAEWWPYTETVYTGPASMALALPTSYVVPTSYLVPTATVVPTVYATAYYAETSAWTPTSYVESAYYVPTSYYVRERVARRPLFGRRRRDYIVPTTIYYPTTTVVPTTARYYAPTVLEYPILSEVRYQSVASSCGTCDNSVVVASAPAPQVERRVVRDEEPARVEESPRRSAVESDALDEESTTSSKVPPAAELEPSDLSPVKKPPATETVREKAETSKPEPKQVSPPIPPAASADATPKVRSSAPPQDAATKPGSTTQSQEAELPPPATITKPDDLPKPSDIDALPPVAPSGPDDSDLPVNEKSAPKSRESLKPVLEMPRPSGLSLLKGRVRSGTSAEPEQGVQITVSNRTNAFEDRTARTNETGKFAMRIPDGDWTVKVTMPSGRVYPVYRITVSGGAIVDDQGRDIPALVIDR